MGQLRPAHVKKSQISERMIPVCNSSYHRIGYGCDLLEICRVSGVLVSFD